MNTNTGKKLLIVTEAVDPAETNLGFFCAWIRELSVHPQVASIEVWCLREGNWSERPANVRVRVLPKSMLAKVFVLSYRVLTTHVDTVFVHMAPIWAALFGPWWRLTGQRVVLWYTHGSTSLALRVACLFVSRIVTATNAAFPIRNAKRDVIGHGIDPDFFSVIHQTRADTPKKYLSVGRMTPRKQVKETIEFFARIHERDSAATFIWIGSPRSESDRAYEQDVQNLIAKLNLTHAVQLRDGIPHDALPQEFAQADMLLHLSATGSLDKVVLESLAAGCPVFSTNPATPEVNPKWYWEKSLDEAALDRVIELGKMGVTTMEHEDMEKRFALPGFIDRLARTSLFPEN